MKKHVAWITAFVLLCWCRVTYSQQLSSCVNADFELGDFTNWTGGTGMCCPVTINTNGIVPGRHTIMSGPGFDPHSNNQIPVVAPGGQYSARLGNDFVGAEAEQLSYTITVSPQTALFIYRYAVVLEDPIHDPSEQPRFQIRVFDQNNNPVGCGTYNVVSGAGIPDFQTWYDPNTGSDIHFKTWTTVGIDLSAYMGQSVTIEFSTGDCSLGGHFGYAYVDAYCSPLIVSSDYCPGASTATLTAPPGFAGYLWSTGENTPSITINNPVVGATYSVLMTSVTGCQITLQQVIAVTTITANFASLTNCVTGTQFTDSSYVTSGSPINQWHWDFDDGTVSNLQNPTHQFPGPGTYHVQLTVTNQGSCIHSATKNIVIMPSPVAGFSAVSGCPQQPIIFTDTSTFSSGTITQYQWNFGDGTPVSNIASPNHTFAGEGPYQVSLIITGSNGCSDTTIQNISTLPKPTAGFYFNVLCQNNTVTFTDTSSLKGGTIVSRQWNFGDGSALSNQPNPTHVYTTGGTFTVQLIVTGGNGCSDTITKNVAMAVYPAAAFTNAAICEKHIAQFTDASSLTGGTITSWQWNFGDGTPVNTLQNPNHNYNSAGNYSVSLIVIGDNGCRDSSSRIITVRSSPVSSFTTQPVCPNQPAYFTGTSTAPAGTTLTSWTWNFGDGSVPVSGQNATHTYLSGGNYSVSYIVTASNGCNDTLESTISTSATPTALFTPPGGCAKSAISFTSHSTVPTGSITGWQWNFGDGSSGTGVFCTHSYPNPGSYNVVLTVTSNNGCTHSVQHEISISAKPFPSFTNSSACVNDSINLISNSATASGSISYVKWDFGDGSFLTGQDQVHHVYSDSGYYHVGLIIGNSLGCYDTIYRNIYVRPLPQVGFTHNLACVNNPVQFHDTSWLAGYNIISWQWDFGDSTTASSSSPIHTFQQYGNFPVTLQIKASNGCSNTIHIPVLINRLPFASFSAADVCHQTPLTVSNLSSLSGGSIVSQQWLWGDGTSDSTLAPQHFYSSEGTYTIHLSVTGSNGCVNDTSVSVVIHNKPVTAFTYSNPCQQMAVQFTDQSVVSGDSLALWQWHFGDGAISTVQNPSHSYSQFQVYNVQLVTFSVFGCSDTAEITIDVAPKPLASFAAANTCFGQPVQFADASSVSPGSIISYLYDFGDGTTSVSANPQHLYATPGDKTITLYIVSNHQCKDSVQATYRIYELPVALFSADTLEGCQPLWVTFTDSSFSNEGNIIRHEWSFGNTFSDTISTPNPQLYDVPGYFDIALYVETDLGCRDTLIKNSYIHVLTKPEAGFITEPSTTSILHAITDIKDLSWGAAEWLYDFNDSTFSSEQNPTHQYAEPGQYLIMQYITSTEGCRDTAFAYVEIKNDYTLYIPNSFTPDNDGYNEIWKVYGIGLSNYSLQLFNRWGQLIYTSTDIEQGWNGTYKNKPVQQGVYIYKIAVQDIFNKKHVYTGSVNLIR